jgi:hypothetical protein
LSFTPFTIIKLEAHSKEELFERLRNVVLMEDRDTKPYLDASFLLAPLSYSDLWPAQRYVLSNNLIKAHHLEWELAALGHHPLELSGYLTIWTDKSPLPIDLLPPIVEQTIEADGTSHAIVNDGLHRLYIGRLAWKIPRVVLVSNIPPEYPYYAYPIPGVHPWDDITVIEGDSIPPGFVKKWHRTPFNKKLYRDFNSVFQNVGGPRGGGVER